jgi:hypothetical protein
MDETGSWEIAKDEYDAFEALDQNSGCLARRLVRLQSDNACASRNRR